MACTENQNNEVSCLLCKTSCSSDWELKEHLWSLMHHVKLEQKSKDTVHQCVLCQTSTENLVDYGRHLNEQKHKQALEKAKEKKQAKPKSSSLSSRHALQKVGKQKSKKSLMPNPNWHLNSSDPSKRESSTANKFRPPFSNWKPGDDWRWQNNSPEMQGSRPNTFHNSHHYWNNYNDKLYYFNANNKRSWKKPGHLLNGNIEELNQQHPNHRNRTKNNVIQPLMSKTLVPPPNHQKLRAGLIPNKTPPPLATKNSKSFANSNCYSDGHQLPLEASSIKSSSKSADNTKNARAKHNSERITKSKKLPPTDSVLNKAKVKTSPQVSKLKINVSKLKGKGDIAKSAVNKKKEKPVFVIDKVGAANATEKCGSAFDNTSRKFSVSPKKSDNISFVSVYKRNAHSPKKKLQVLSQNGKLMEKRQIYNENKTNICENSTAAKTNSLVNLKNSNANNSGITNSKEDAIASLKRNFNLVDSPKPASSFNLTKKQKILPKSDTLEPRTKLNKADTANLATSPGTKQKTAGKIHSSKTNDSSEKDKPSHLNPTKEQKTSPKILSFEQNENNSKVNKEFVTELHNNLAEKHLADPPNSNIESKTTSQENLTHTKDETNLTIKQATASARQEELVKMMKLPRLSRKEKMHLSSLLQSYTKLQNKKLAVPRLTMKLSGLYDISSQDISDVGGISELQLPAGMEEQIAYLIKRENLEADDSTDKQNTRLPTHPKKSQLKNTKTKVSSTQKGSIKNKTVSENSQAGSLSTQDISSARSVGQCSSNVKASPVETISSRENIVSKEPTNINPKQNNIQLENNSSSCTTLSNPSESSSKINSSAPVITDTQSNSSENILTSNKSNPESVFSKVYSLTLREEQIRSSIVDTNEKMNYLHKLIQDSQMALQQCRVEHELLLEEEIKIREQRLKILQDAMNGKTSSVDAMDPPTPQQTSPLHPMPASITNSQPASTSSETTLAWGQSSISHCQKPSETTILNQPSQQSSSYHTGTISSVNRCAKQTQESFPCSLDHSFNLSTFQPQKQSSVPVNSLPRDEPSTIAAVCKTKASRSLNNGASLPLNTISSNSDTNTTNNVFSENRNADVNICANVTQNREPSLGIGDVTIKQEPPSPPLLQANIETALSISEGLVHNNTCDNKVRSTESFSDSRQNENAILDSMTDTVSNNTRKLELVSASTENESFERVQIKKEPLTPPPPPQTETQEYVFELKLPSLDNHKKLQSKSQTKLESSSFHTKSIKKERNQFDWQTDEITPNEVTPDDSLERVRGNELTNSVGEGLQPTLITTPEMQPGMNFESVQIKKEPLTPPPHSPVKGDETFFVPQLLNADNSEENPSLQNHAKHQMEIEKTVEDIYSPSSPRNPLEPESLNENPGKSGGMSMTYLGSMPNNFLEQLTLSWKKQNLSATMKECVASSNEHSFSDSESTSSHTVCNFIKRSSPKFSVPARMNPRVCLEPLNMKFHRKRTFSEPVSASDSSLLSPGNLEQNEFPAKKKSLEKLSSVQKSSEEERLNCDDNLDIVEEEDFESPEVNQTNLRPHEKESGFKEKTSESQTYPSTKKIELISHEDVTDSLLNEKEDNMDPDMNDVDNLKESEIFSPVSAESSPKIKSDIKLNSPISSLNEPSTTSPNAIQTEINSDPKFHTDPLNILNNLSSLHVVRTKKFPRTHADRNQLPTYKGANSPVNGLYVFENQLYASYQGNSPCKFSIGTGECLQIYNCKPFNVQCMHVCRISSNKVRLFSGGASEVLIVFDEETGKRCSKIDTYKKIYSLHENWGSLFVGLADGGVTKINLKSLRKTSELSYGSKPINCLATCIEGAQKLLCVGAYDASILIVDAMTGLLLKTLNCYHRLLYSIKVHQSLIFSCSNDKTLQVHDITSGKLLHCIQDHASTISCLHVEANLLVTGSYDKRLNIYNSSNPREAPVIFYTASKEPISCLTVHDRVVYCGNFFGHIETIQFDTGQKWNCKYDSCEMTFGQRQGLFYHLVNQHLQMTGLNKKKCLWQDCEQFIYSVLDITEHCENHINQILQPE